MNYLKIQLISYRNIFKLLCVNRVISFYETWNVNKDKQKQLLVYFPIRLEKLNEDTSNNTASNKVA